MVKMVNFMWHVSYHWMCMCVSQRVMNLRPVSRSASSSWAAIRSPPSTFHFLWPKVNHSPEADDLKPQAALQHVWHYPHFTWSAWLFIISLHHKKGKHIQDNKILLGGREIHTHIAFMTVYCYNCAILLVVIVDSLLLCLIYKNRLYTYYVGWGDNVVSMGFGTDHDFWRALGVWECIPYREGGLISLLLSLAPQSISCAGAGSPVRRQCSTKKSLKSISQQDSSFNNFKL